MSWWLFLPFAYLAMGLDQICASEWAWRGTAPGFLLLLWSMLAVRPVSSRSMIQAALLGLLVDLGTGSPLGLTAAVFVTVSFLSGHVLREGASEPRSWLLWSFPLMLMSLGAVDVCEWLWLSSTVPVRLLIRHSLLTALVTFGWGASLKLFCRVFRQLVRFPRTSVPRELEASSFFLSR